ncbi:MAG: hypothetical protein WBI74_07875 [Caldicoprobacterales bacterium]|nr:hypothetical protein [Clostridiales bacterium]
MNYKSLIVVCNTGDSTISVIDPYLFREIERIQLPNDSGPYHLVGYDKSCKILVSQYYADSITSIDLLKGEILDSVATGRRPWYMVCDQEGGLAFVTNSDSDTISVVCIKKMKLISQMKTGSMPQGIDFNPHLRTLAIANFNSNNIMIIDADDLSEKKIIRLDKNPMQVKYSSKGDFLYIGCTSSNNSDMGSIKILDTGSYDTLTDISLNALPGQICNTKDGKYILIASMGNGGLVVVDIGEKKIVNHVPTNGMTHGMAMDPKEKYVYVTNPNDNSISVVDWVEGKKINSMKVGKEPNGIIFI